VLADAANRARARLPGRLTRRCGACRLGTVEACPPWPPRAVGSDPARPHRQRPQSHHRASHPRKSTTDRRSITDHRIALEHRDLPKTVVAVHAAENRVPRCAATRLANPPRSCLRDTAPSKRARSSHRPRDAIHVAEHSRLVTSPPAPASHTVAPCALRARSGGTRATTVTTSAPETACDRVFRGFVPVSPPDRICFGSRGSGVQISPSDSGRGTR
jgi:hypothetical protein